MGYIKHHAIVITGWDEVKLNEIRETVCKIINEEFDGDECGSMVTNILISKTNGYCTFFVGPDGSKEGWDSSDRGDKSRSRILQFIQTDKNYHDYAEFFYGEDDGESEIINHN